MEWVASAARRRTVFCTDDEEGESAFDEDNLKGLARRQASVEGRVREFVTAQIASLKANARLDESRRWTDPEFGPNEGDPDGRRSLFRNPRKSTPGYPQPHEIAWLRPGYSDESDVIEDQFCDNAILFRQPSTEATLVQGKLGDCWLLNALAVASTRAGLIESVFWRRDDFKDFGIFVCRFFKDGAWYYVIVDDRIPVVAGEHGQPCFAHTKDPSELWLPLLEKAYAKLHMSYDSLTGGDLEVALREISGWATCKRLLSAFDIESPLQDLDATWRYLRTALDYGSAIGCIARPEDRKESATMLQQLPNNSQSSSQAMARKKSDPNASLQEDSVLPAALRGLETRHAYSIVAAKTVRATRVVLVRNVWGFGQWKGPWSRGSPEFAAHEKDLQSLFPHRDLDRNECFLMAYEDFTARFSSLIYTIQLKTVFALDQLISVGSQWSGARFTHKRELPGSSPGEAQPMYTYSTSCEKEIFLSAGDYALVPHTFDRGHVDDFVLTMYFDKSIFLENSEALGEDEKEVVTRNPFQDSYVPQGDESMPQPGGEMNDQETPVLAVNEDQREQARALRAELFKERLAAIAEERGISQQSILAAFQGYGRLSRVDFKRSMVDLHFSVSEIPDADFEALAYPETTVSCAKIRGIFEQNMLRQTLFESRPGEHADDLMFRPPVTAPGQLSITVHEAQDLVLKDDGQNNTQLLRFTPAQSNESQKLRAVQRSEVMRVDGKLVILCSWLVPLNADLAAVLRASRPVGGDNLCVPVAYEVASGLEYSFTSSPWLWVFDHELHDAAFWKNHFVAWATDSRLCIEAIPNVLRSSLDHDKANEPFSSPRSAAYVPDRRRVVHDILEKLRTQAPQGHEEVTSPATSMDNDAVAMNEKNQSWAEPRPKTHPLAASLRVVETLYSASNRLAALDRERNVALWKLQSYSGSARRAMSRKVVARGIIPKELTASSEELAKLEQVSENPASITPNPETSDTEASTTEALKADDALVSLFLSSIFGDTILGQVFEAIMYGRDAEIQAGGWTSGSSDEMNEGSVGSSIVTLNKDERLVYSGMVPMVGEAKVLKHQLSRSANLQAWFDKFDRDGNGLIEPREFERALEALGFRLSASELQSLLTHLDTNGDGQINPDEFIAFVNAETDSAALSESEVLLEHVVSALASSGINREALTQPWSVGLDWFKLRHFASQLRELTMTCPLLAQRSLFMAAPKAVGIRAYRVAHLFETKEAFAAFLARHHEHHASEQNQEAPPVRSPERARSMLRCIVEAVQRGGEVSATLPPVGNRDGGKTDFDLDMILERLPKFLSRHSSVSVSEKIKSGELARGILEAYARAEVAASVQATSPDAESEDTVVRAVLERYATDVGSNVGREGIEEDEGRPGSVTLTIAEEMRMLVDDALIRCKASHVNRAVLARMLSPDRVLAVSLKLRHALRQQRALRDNPSLFLVDVYVCTEKQTTGSNGDVERRVRVSPELDVVYRRDRGSVRIERNKVNEDSSKNTLRIYARNPCNGRVLELDKVLIDDNLVAKLPKASLGPGGWTYEVASDAKVRMSSDEPKEFAMSDLREVHVLQELVARLSMCKSVSSEETNRLALHLRECPEKVNFVRRMLDSLNESSFFVQVTDVAVHFRADRGETGISGFGSCKSAVVAALREQQGGRLAAALSTLDVTLQVVFEETQGDFREEMTWAEFAAYLAEERNSLVEPFGSRDQNDAGNQTSETLPGAYSAETLAVLDKYGVVQGDSTAGVELETSFPLQDDRAWDELLEHLCLGSCLTPHVEATVYNVGGEAMISAGSASRGEAVTRREIGKARFPLSIVTESPGVGLTRWLSLVDEKHGECGRLRVSFRFDDSSMIAAKENAKVSESKKTSSRNEGAGRGVSAVNGQVKEEEKKGMEEEQKDTSSMSSDKFAIPAGGDEMLPANISGGGDGKEDSSLELVHRRAQTAKDYAVLAQRLREEMLEAKTKLAESERARGELEQTVSRNEDRLRQTRGELEHQQRRLREAEAQVRAAEPQKPKRGADAKTLEEHAREKREHEARLRELDVLREDNEKLRMVTDTRETKLRSELQQLRTQLQETELKLRVEATEKQELLGSVERANAEAHEGLARTSARVAANILASGNTTRGGGISRKPREQRERERRRRDEWLQTRLQADYKTYRREFDGCVGEVERQLRARRPDDPRRPLKAFEQLLLAQAVVTHPEPRVTAEGFEEALANFGLVASPRDLDLLKAHFDTHSDGTLAVDDFLDTLRDHMEESDALAASGAATATHGFRGVQAVQRKRY
ncbi:Calpain [Hondaea fermentalgiana]|uniref:Calpain n=1 Tax=Hondaea fermentalgiana TaxID=2315210 RepID=A0A2R5G811_9STRA|nr:Calpain [Hondaea fermentalgiana]|eukprot:GBG23834.1 Calpain [Hondaea fermentalgiana]